MVLSALASNPIGQETHECLLVTGLILPLAQTMHCVLSVVMKCPRAQLVLQALFPSSSWYWCAGHATQAVPPALA